MQTSPKDDLYLYANYDWLLNTDMPEGDRVVGMGLDTEGREHAAEAVSGEDLKGHDARQAQLLYRAALNIAARDAAGTEPAKGTISDIRSLSTIDDVSAFLLDSERGAGAPSLIRVVNKNDPSDSTRYAACVQLSPATFGSSMGTMGMDATMVAPEDDLYQARLACASSVLTRCGLSEDEAKDAFKNRQARIRCQAGQLRLPGLLRKARRDGPVLTHARARAAMHPRCRQAPVRVPRRQWICADVREVLRDLRG